MTVDPQLVAELRRMFLEGATPSRLARHVGDLECPDRVPAYFQEAFRVAVLGSELHAELADAELLRDMVGRNHLWRQPDDLEPVWWDGLTVSPDDLRMVEAIHPEAHPALKDVWPSLPARAQGAIRQAMVNAQAYHERTQVLTRLVERLQEQVVRLEQPSELAAACP